MPRDPRLGRLRRPSARRVRTLAAAVSAWWPEILAFIPSGTTNAGSEDTNRLIKTIARDAHGFRNPETQRLRTRCGATRRA